MGKTDSRKTGKNIR